jgi:hypothetical protein
MPNTIWNSFSETAYFPWELTRDILRRAALELLNVLVDRGSSLAFQLRELIVAPMSAA